MATYKGIVPASQQYIESLSGNVYRETHLVLDADSWYAARNTPGVPAYGDILTDDPTLKALAFNVKPVKTINTGTEIQIAQDFHIEVEYSNPTGILQTDQQYVEWQGGLTQVKISGDTLNNPLGSRNYWCADGLNESSIYNPDAVVSADASVATLECQIHMPSTYNSTGLVTTLTDRLSCCNNANMTIDGYVIPPYCAMLISANIRPITNIYRRVSFVFRIGRILKSVLGMPVYNANTNTPYPGTYIGIGQLLVPRNTADALSYTNGVPTTNGMQSKEQSYMFNLPGFQILNKRTVSYGVFQTVRPADMSVLGIT